MNDTYTSLITSSFGISNQMLWWIMIVGASLFGSIAVGIYTRSSLIAMFFMPFPFVFGMVFGYIPYWIAFMLPMPLIYTIFYAPQGESIESDNLKPYWEQQGENIKNAYRSKFGGDNPEFDKEVDNHVRIMINNGRGFTNTLAHDWMKRMAKFTESK